MSVSLLQPLNNASTTVVTQPQPYIKASHSSNNSPSTGVIVIIIVVLTAVASACIYVLFRYLSERFHRSVRTFSVSDDVSRSDPALIQTESNSVLQSLPLFRFRSVKGNLTGGDCAVCLSKFEPTDELRLLPLCCHAFHAECIDTWIQTNQTCPLCRSTVIPENSDALGKILPSGSRSFRIEIGSVSSRQNSGIVEEALHSYSVGSSLDYIVSDENGYEISIGEICDLVSAEKESTIGVNVPEPPGEFLASSVTGGRSWLRDYVDMLNPVSLSSSFRSSGRFFSGSSRRSDPVADVDLEANQAGEEISELFRWLSGI